MGETDFIDLVSWTGWSMALIIQSILIDLKRLIELNVNKNSLEICSYKTMIFTVDYVMIEFSCYMEKIC